MSMQVVNELHSEHSPEPVAAIWKSLNCTASQHFGLGPLGKVDGKELKDDEVQKLDHVGLAFPNLSGRREAPPMAKA